MHALSAEVILVNAMRGLSIAQLQPAICHQRGMGIPVLVGCPDEVRRVAKRQQLDIEGIEMIDPDAVRERYVPKLMEMRKHKNLSEQDAREARPWKTRWCWAL